MNFKTIAIVFLSLLAQTEVNAQWSDPKTDTLGFGYDLVGLAPSNSNTWIATGGNAIVFKTTDGWQTFSKINANIFTSVRAANAGLNGYFAIHTSPDKWSSNNNGNTWSIEGGSGIEYLSMVDSAYGIGTYGCGVLKTNNGGMSWLSIGSVCSNNNSMSGISFPSKKTGFVCGNNSTFSRTQDSGATWVNISTNAGFSYSGVAYDVFFVDENVGYVSRGVNTTGGMLKKTNDGGNTWIDLTSNFQAAAGTENKNMRIYFLDANTGYVSHGGKIYKTTNGGTNWTLDHVHPRRDPTVYTYSNVKRKGNTLVFSGDGCMVSVLKLSSTNNINKYGKNEIQFQIYPNPVNDKLNINCNCETKEIQLHSMEGRLVKSIEGSKIINNTIDLQNIEQGVYLIKVFDQFGNSKTSKVVIAH